jgi:2-succinyl-6-hydroxy-2,4-cyclohexadiene-1-carboxylate synthase
MVEWSRLFNKQIEKQYGYPSKENHHIIVGYSLGARLAMHLLQDNPKLWDAAVLVSAHTGMNMNENRLLADRAWADKFRSNPWDEVMNAWEDQEVFRVGSTRFTREEKYYQRELLAEILTHWSVGHQKDFQTFLQSAPVPILWCAGLNDRAYTERAKKLSLSHPQSKIALFSEAGHRVPWDQPKKFIFELEAFINSLKRMVK